MWEIGQGQLFSLPLIAGDFCTVVSVIFFFFFAVKLKKNSWQVDSTIYVVKNSYWF